MNQEGGIFRKTIAWKKTQIKLIKKYNSSLYEETICEMIHKENNLRNLVNNRNLAIASHNSYNDF